MDLDTPALKSLYAECYRCKSPTRQEVIRSQSETGSNEDIDWYHLELQIIRCQKCQNIYFKHSTWKSADAPSPGLHDDPHSTSEADAQRPPSVDPWELPGRVRALYAETLSGFNANAMTISASGIRSLVDAICLEQGCDDLTLELKIHALVAKEVISHNDADRLRKVRFLTTNSDLYLDTPSKDEFEITLQFIEHLLTTIYVLPQLDKRLRRLRPNPSPSPSSNSGPRPSSRPSPNSSTKIH